MKSPKFYTCAIAVLLLMFGVALDPVEAQQPKPDQVEEDLLRFGFTSLMQSTKQRALSKLRSRMDDLKLAVELPDQDVRKLAVAAKGAVKSYMANVNVQLVKSAALLGFEFDPEFELDLKAEEQREELDFGLLGAKLWSTSGAISSLGRVEDEEIWKSAVKSVLTDEQTTQIEQLNELRKSNSQFIAVSKYISRVDQELLLTPEQKKQLWNAVNDGYGKLITDNFDYLDTKDGSFLMNSFGAGVAGGGNSWIAILDLSLVDEILSESQLDLWKPKFGVELLVLKRNQQREKSEQEYATKEQARNEQAKQE